MKILNLRKDFMCTLHEFKYMLPSVTVQDVESTVQDVESTVQDVERKGNHINVTAFFY